MHITLTSDFFHTDKGKVFSCGENKMGQLGLGNQSSQVTVPTQVTITFEVKKFFKAMKCKKFGY